MLYDERLLDLFIEVQKKHDSKIARKLLILRKLLSNKVFKVLITIIERIIAIIVTLPIPFYKDIMEMVITYLPGTPYLIGNYLRGIYYSRKLKRMGKNCIIDQGVVIVNPQNVEIDDFVWIDHNVFIRAEMKIGRGVHIAPNCMITAGKCILEDYVGLSLGVIIVGATETSEGGARMSGPMIPLNQRNVMSADVLIKKDAFIGMGAKILPGITLGEGCIIGAGAVVTKDVEPWTIATGIPARSIRRRNQIVHPDPYP